MKHVSDYETVIWGRINHEQNKVLCILDIYWAQNETLRPILSTKTHNCRKNTLHIKEFTFWLQYCALQQSVLLKVHQKPELLSKYIAPIKRKELRITKIVKQGDK